MGINKNDTFLAAEVLNKYTAARFIAYLKHIFFLYYPLFKQ